MSKPKFQEGAKVRVAVDGRNRLGRVSGVIAGAKRNARRYYMVTAESNGALLGRYRSDELLAR